LRAEERARITAEPKSAQSCFACERKVRESNVRHFSCHFLVALKIGVRVGSGFFASHYLALKGMSSAASGGESLREQFFEIIVVKNGEFS